MPSILQQAGASSERMSWLNINVAVIDELEIIRLGVQQSLTSVSRVTFVGSFSTIASFYDSPAYWRTHILLVSDSLPNVSVPQATEQILQDRPDIAILVLGSRLTPQTMYEIVYAGAMGVVCKHEPVQDILRTAIHQVHLGQIYFSTHAMKIASQTPEAQFALSPRLQEVLMLMAQGVHVQEIAQMLDVTPRAIYSARNRLREILEVATNEQIIAAAIRRDLLRGFIERPENYDSTP
jgi:DNA-binding NarL/FixJ family response regulator